MQGNFFSPPFSFGLSGGLEAHFRTPKNSPLQVATVLAGGVGESFASGLLLSTGLVRQAPCVGQLAGGTGSVGAPSGPGDADLDLVLLELRPIINLWRLQQGLPEWTASELVAAGPTLNACSLTFRFSVFAGSSLKIPMTLASEEWPVTKGANDLIMARLTNLNTSATRNVARVPTTNEPVNVISVNPGLSADFFDAAIVDDPASVFGADSVYGGNGQTRNIIGRAAVTRGDVLEVKLAIASVGNIYNDSTLYVGPITTDIALSFTTPFGSNSLVEGCSNGTIKVTLLLPETVSTQIPLTFPSSAGWGPTDFTLTPPPLQVIGNQYLYVLPAGTTELVIKLNPIDDAIAEGPQVATVCYGSDCKSATVYDSFTISSVVSNPATVCVDVPGSNRATLQVACPLCDVLGALIQWEGPAIIGATNGSSILVQPLAGSNVYAVRASAPPSAPTCIATGGLAVQGLTGQNCVTSTTTTTTGTSTTTPAPTPPPGSCDLLPAQQSCLAQFRGPPAVCAGRPTVFFVQTFSSAGVEAACGPTNCGLLSWSIDVYQQPPANFEATPTFLTTIFPSACSGGNYTWSYTPSCPGIYTFALFYAGQRVQQCSCPVPLPGYGVIADDCNKCAYPGGGCQGHHHHYHQDFLVDWKTDQ